jgi:hypothetical protein
MRQTNPKLEIASGEFDRRAQMIKQPGISVVARQFGVSEKALRNYRANNISRKRGTYGNTKSTT